MLLRNALIEYLGCLVTEHKRTLFERILVHRTQYLQVVLDAVEDPLDANAAFRSCECFGIQNVHWRQNEGGGKMSRGVSVGATKWLNLQTYRSPETRCMAQLRDSGFRQFALSTRADALSIEALPLDKPFALWFASETEGLRPETASGVDGFVRLPMQGFGTHFNFSVTVALALQILTDRLRDENQPWQLSTEAKSLLLLDWYATIPERRKALVQRFLAEHDAVMSDLAPPQTSEKFWAMMAPLSKPV